MGNINTALDYADNSLKLGKLVFPVLGDVSAAFTTIGAMIKAGNASPNVIGEIRAVSGKLDKLHRMMVDNNASLRALIVHHEWYCNIIIPVENLNRLMLNSIKERTSATTFEFKNQCKLQNPHVLVMSINGRINHGETNPLIAAMENDRMRTWRTFELWKTWIHNALATLHTVHAYYRGICNEGESFSAQAMDDAIAKVKQDLDSFIKNYRPDYWPHCVERLMERVADNNTHVGNSAKAVILRNELNSIYTYHEFLVLVYNDCGGYSKHCFQWNGDNAICQFRRGKCNMVIYRSRLNISKEKVDNLKSEVSDLQERPEYRGDYEKKFFIFRRKEKEGGLSDSVEKIYNDLDDAGFVGIISQSPVDVCLEWSLNNNTNGMGKWVYADYRALGGHEEGYGDGRCFLVACIR